MKMITFKPSMTRKPASFPFDGLWSDFFDSDLNTLLRDTRHHGLPAVNVKETENDFRIELAVPGMSKENIFIEVDEDLLRIKGEDRQEKEAQETDGRYTRREFAFQSFERSFRLPDSVDQGSIKAEYLNGVLTVVLAKKEEAKPVPPRRIDIA